MVARPEATKLARRKSRRRDLPNGRRRGAGRTWAGPGEDRRSIGSRGTDAAHGRQTRSAVREVRGAGWPVQDHPAPASTPDRGMLGTGLPTSPPASSVSAENIDRVFSDGGSLRLGRATGSSCQLMNTALRTGGTAFDRGEEMPCACGGAPRRWLRRQCDCTHRRLRRTRLPSLLLEGKDP